MLEESHRRIREIEARLNQEDLEPEDALRKLVAFTFDYQHDNEDFIRLVMNENMHRREYLTQSQDHSPVKTFPPSTPSKASPSAA